MSGFYDDGGVAFAQEQFDNARKRRDKEAKKQDKFSRRLLLADLAGKGFNIFLNNKADKLEQEELFKNSNLFSEVEASTNFLNFYNEEKTAGKTDRQIFRDYVNDDFARFIDPNNEGYVLDARDSLVNDYVTDETNFNNFMGMVNHHKKIGSIDPDQLTEFIKSGVKAPRNIGELIGNKIKKITMSHTDETLQAKDAQVKSEVIDRLANLGFNFGESVNTYKGGMSIIEQEIKNNPEKYKPYIKTEFKDLQMLEIDNQLVPHIIIKKDYKDGTFTTEALPVMAAAQRIPIKELTQEELSDNQDLISGLTTDMDYMEAIEPGFRNYFNKQFQGVNRENPEFLVQNYKDVNAIVAGQKYILKNYRNLISDPITAMEYSIASMYLNRQRGINASKPSLYDIEMIALEKNVNAEYDDVAGKIEMYLNDFEKNYGEVERDILINSMLKELPKMFTEEADRDRANQVLSRKGYQTLDDVETILKEEEEENITSNTISPFFQYNTKFKDNPLG